MSVFDITIKDLIVSQGFEEYRRRKIREYYERAYDALESYKTKVIQRQKLLKQIKKSS
jgi:hypothetical protein